MELRSELRVRDGKRGRERETAPPSDAPFLSLNRLTPVVEALAGSIGVAGSSFPPVAASKLLWRGRRRKADRSSSSSTETAVASATI